MSEKWHFKKGHLKLERVAFEVSSVEFSVDMWESDTQPPQGEFIDGVRLLGVLAYDVWFNNQKVGKHRQGELTVQDPDYTDDKTTFRVILMELKDTKIMVPNKHKRHLWMFAGLGRPLHDKIGIFPQDCLHPRLKIFLVPEFVGYFNISGYGIVIAKDDNDARDQFNLALVKRGLAMSSVAGYSLLEVNPARLQETMKDRGLIICPGAFDLTVPCVVVLADGSE